MTETYKRIKVALAAMAYEKYSYPIMSDAEFDKLAREIDLSVTTDRPDMDKWYKDNFQPHTGSWIWNHPEPERLEEILQTVFKLGPIDPSKGKNMNDIVIETLDETPSIVPTIDPATQSSVVIGADGNLAVHGFVQEAPEGEEVL